MKNISMPHRFGAAYLFANRRMYKNNSGNSGERGKNMKKIVAILLTVALLLSFAGCGGKAAPASVRVMVLSGSTGFGMAGLMHAQAAGESAQDYAITLENDASNVTAALISGSVDIAALPTNAASVVFNKTQGAVQALALNTQGVLYLLSGGETVGSFSDLRGRTVYVPAQNPTFIFTCLCEANGLKVGEDVMIDNTYAQPADLRTALASGEVELAVLPEPMVTVALAANEALSVQLDLTEEWDKVEPEGTLVQGCVVVRKEFAEAYPDQVKTFLEEYGASIALCAEDPDTSASYIVEAGIVPKEGVAKAALSRCNLCFFTGEEMKTRLSDYLACMAQVDAAGIGGAVPTDDFYYIP